MIKQMKKIGKATLYCADCKDVLPLLKEIDACVTDPPYGLSFMGKQWDYEVPGVEVWTKVNEVLKPGAHLLSFFGSRTYHRGAIPIEDAGFEIRDQLMWLYGSGFPKSHNIGKAVDELQRNESKWEGWGTALKPAHEPIVMARKPFKGSVAENVLEHGTGGININDCRVETDDKLSIGSNKRDNANVNFGMKDNKEEQKQHEQGRYPANVMHDGSDVVLDIFPHTKSGKMKQHIEGGNYNVYGKMYPRDVETIGDEGFASRFFYCAKASKEDRDEGLENFVEAQTTDGNIRSNSETARKFGANSTLRKNVHPTVKPTELMRYLCRLVIPKGGIVLDPFMGSGSTGKAAVMSGFKFIGIEMDEEYFDIACARIERAQIQGDLFY